MTVKEIKKALQDCGCRKYDNESNEAWQERMNKLVGHYEGSWCDFNAPCPRLTADEILAFIAEEGCICASPEAFKEMQHRGLCERSICEKCKTMKECFPNGAADMVADYK